MADSIPLVFTGRTKNICEISERHPHVYTADYIESSYHRLKIASIIGAEFLYNAKKNELRIWTKRVYVNKEGEISPQESTKMFVEFIISDVILEEISTTSLLANGTIDGFWFEDQLEGNWNSKHSGNLSKIFDRRVPVEIEMSIEPNYTNHEYTNFERQLLGLPLEPIKVEKTLTENEKTEFDF